MITNQVYTDIENNSLRPLGGTYLEHMCKAIVFLEKKGRRFATRPVDEAPFPAGGWNG